METNLRKYPTCKTELRAGHLEEREPEHVRPVRVLRGQRGGRRLQPPAAHHGQLQALLRGTHHSGQTTLILLPYYFKLHLFSHNKNATSFFPHYFTQIYLPTQ
jgi:hypothetical protein